MMLKRYIIFFLFLLSSINIGSVNVPEYLLNKEFKDNFESKQYADAEKVISTLLEKNANDGYYLHNLGQTQLLSKNYEAASKSFEQALSLIPNTQTLNTKLNLAAANLLQQKIDPAIDIYKAILKDVPSNPIAKHNLELALEMKQQQQQQQQQDQQQQDQQQQDQQQQDQQQQDQQQQDQQQQDQQQQDQGNANDYEQELSDARKEQQQKEQEQKEAAYDILDALSQRERDARKKHLTKQQSQQGSIEYDW